MGSRRQAREQALQLLYQLDLRPPAVVDRSSGLDAAIVLFWKREPADPDVVEFAQILVRGVHRHRETIDELISEASHNWKVGRMSFVDRNILRLAVFELKELEEVPAMVAINEGIELGKRFGTTESGAFINGILDRVARKLRRIGEGE